jgi:ribosomal protein S5
VSVDAHGNLHLAALIPGGHDMQAYVSFGGHGNHFVVVWVVGECCGNQIELVLAAGAGVVAGDRRQAVMMEAGRQTTQRTRALQ